MQNKCGEVRSLEDKLRAIVKTLVSYKTTQPQASICTNMSCYLVGKSLLISEGKGGIAISKNSVFEYFRSISVGGGCGIFCPPVHSL